MKRVLAVAVVIFLITLLLAFCGDAISAGSQAQQSEPSSAVSQPRGDLSTPDGDSKVEKVQPTAPQTDTSAESVAAVAEYNDAAGRIISEFFSPDSAPQHFGKIYMKNSTGQAIDIEQELTQRPKLSLSLDGTPEVLILHTHATESYMLQARDYFTEADAVRSQDSSVNMVRVGQAMAQRLEENGIGVIHDTTLHDAVSYTGSYDRSLETAEALLQKYPSIQVILDLHRDSISRGEDKLKTVCEVGGRNAAQLMVVLGCEDGSAPAHPNWRENLRFALRYQQALEMMYPGLARPLSVVAHRYNQHLAPGAMLIELGTEANTLEEAIYTAQLAGDTLARVLKLTAE